MRSKVWRTGKEKMNATQINSYPRCASYLKRMGIKLSDPQMEMVHYAWLLGDNAFSEEELVKMGAANITNMQWGELIPRMEVCFAKRPKTRKPDTAGLSQSQTNQFRGWISCYGIKGNRLNNPAEMLRAAKILWPSIVKGDDIVKAYFMLASTTKKRRAAIARANLHSLPADLYPLPQ